MPKFELEDFCRIIQELKVTFAYVVPPVVLLLGKHPVVSKYDLSSLRMMSKFTLCELHVRHTLTSYLHILKTVVPPH
jgi:hypothetical protein